LPGTLSKQYPECDGGVGDLVSDDEKRGGAVILGPLPDGSRREVYRMAPRRRTRWWIGIAVAVVVAVAAGLVIGLHGGGGGGSMGPATPVTLPTTTDTEGAQTGDGATAVPDRVAEQARPACPVSKILVPSCGRWLGVAPGALTGEDPAAALTAFEAEIGRPVDIYHAYHTDADVFPTAQEIAIARDPNHPRMLFLNWKPDREVTWSQVADGAADARIDALARRLRTTFPDRFFLTIWHEPENDVVPQAGSGMTALDYAAMFRHVITRLRADGATGVVSVMDYIGAPKWGSKSWFPQLYPGDGVVDWIAYDPYINAAPQAGRPADLSGLANRTGPGWPGFYTWAARQHPGKPLMMAEFGVFERNGQTNRKAALFARILGQLPKFPRLRALVYFDSPQAPKGDTSIASSPASKTAFAKLAASPALTGPLPPTP
jgi:hypothetical protein